MKRTLCSLITTALAGWATAAPAPTRLPAGYTLETIEIPSPITLGVGGLAFTPKGDLLICTREGEIWRYRNGDWSLFAQGLHERKPVRSGSCNVRS
jgi:hypothetical protein